MDERFEERLRWLIGKMYTDIGRGGIYGLCPTFKPESRWVRITKFVRVPAAEKNGLPNVYVPHARVMRIAYNGCSVGDVFSGSRDLVPKKGEALFNMFDPDDLVVSKISEGSLGRIRILRYSSLPWNSRDVQWVASWTTSTTASTNLTDDL